MHVDTATTEIAFVTQFWKYTPNMKQQSTDNTFKKAFIDEIHT
jgi:hypothetical protein